LKLPRDVATRYKVLTDLWRIDSLEAVVASASGTQLLPTKVTSLDNFALHTLALSLGLVAHQNDTIAANAMTDQSPQSSHEQAREPEAQLSELDPMPYSNETVSPAEDKTPEHTSHDDHASDEESVYKTQGVEVQDIKTMESKDEEAAKDGDKGEEEEKVKEEDDGDDDDDDDDDEDDEEEEEEEEDDEEDEEEDDDDDDEEPKLKYARLTQHLNGVYRNGDATSAFLVAGDKMVSSVCSSSHGLANCDVDRWNA
jgi:type IV secretory pathway VirB10-like protein